MHLAPWSRKESPAFSQFSPLNALHEYVDLPRTCVNPRSSSSEYCRTNVLRGEVMKPFPHRFSTALATADLPNPVGPSSTKTFFPSSKAFWMVSKACNCP